MKAFEPNPEDLLIEPVMQKLGTFTSAGAAGVKVTHLPSGATATATHMRSQHANREVALQMLRRKLACATNP